MGRRYAATGCDSRLRRVGVSQGVRDALRSMSSRGIAMTAVVVRRCNDALFIEKAGMVAGRRCACRSRHSFPPRMRAVECPIYPQFERASSRTARAFGGAELLLRTAILAALRDALVTLGHCPTSLALRRPALSGNGFQCRHLAPVQRRVRHGNKL